MTSAIRLRQIAAICMLGLFMTSFACRGGLTGGTLVNGPALTEEEKHRLYSAALAASDSPPDSETFRNVCRRIGIFDENGRRNANYMPFVAAHVDWVRDQQSQIFRAEIGTRQK